MAIQILITSQVGSLPSDLCCCPSFDKFIGGNTIAFDSIKYSDVADLNQYEAEAYISVNDREYYAAIQLVVRSGYILGYATFTDKITKQVSVNVLDQQITIYPRLPIYNVWNRIRLPLHNEFVEVAVYDDRPLLDLNAGDNAAIHLYQQIVLEIGGDTVASPYSYAVLKPSTEKNGRFTDRWSLIDPLGASVDYDPLPWHPQDSVDYEYTRYQFSMTEFTVKTKPGQIEMYGKAEMLIAPEYTEPITNATRFADPKRISMNNMAYPWVTKFTVISSEDPTNCLIKSGDLITYYVDEDLKIYVNAYLIGYDVAPG
jgi:hypothetical protein